MKRIMCLICTTVLMLTSFNAEVLADNVSQIIGDGNTVVFVDVPEDHWAKDEIYYFASQGIVTGVGNDKFDPNGSVTREQFTKMLVLAFSAPLKNPDETSFADVGKDKWSYSYIETCKDFLTGYGNVFGGKPSFRPTQAATREDIAVALVRMMGLTDKDVENSSYAQYQFNDSDDISPQLMKYVSLATERKLITGYKDGKFYPKKGITRAETVALINRATKQAMTTINGEIKLEVSVVAGENPQNVSLMILTEEGAKVTVDGKEVELSGNGEGGYEGVYSYYFENEASKSFNVEASKLGKTQVKQIEAKYEIGLPKLKITSCPSSVTTKEVTISGTMKDDNYEVDLYINDKLIAKKHTNWDSEYWIKSYTLEEGENTFNIVLKNSAGKEVKETKVINFSVGGPKLKITNCPSSVTTKTVTIEGTMKDDNYGVDLYINDKFIAKNYTNWDTEYWSKNYTLSEGENTFNIVLKNSAGKETKETKVITFAAAAPKIEFDGWSELSESSQYRVTGKITGESEDVTFYINDEEVSLNYSNNFSKTLNLSEGDNSFVFRAVNAYGKSQSIAKTIKYAVVKAPTLEINDVEETTSESSITLSGNISDELDSNVELRVNDQVVFNGVGNWSTSVSLVEGNNTIIFTATNKYGKSITITKTVNKVVEASN